MISFINADLELDRQPILTDINLTIDRGELVYIVGKSGSGKSTLLKALYMDIKPRRGEVSIAGYSSSTTKRRHIAHLRRKLGIVFQDFRLLHDRSVYDNLAFVLKVTNTRQSLIRDSVMQALEEVGLAHAARQMPLNLSGGEQQRVAIARALVREPVAILADEPTGNLDPDTSLEILEYLKKINQKGIVVVIATHDYELVRHHPARTLQISGDTIRETTFSNSPAGYRPLP
ncbi:ATP-binding cassette domain-containing protein [Prosthecochloris sp. N3]|uniref:ATP-binding cassette domain-containing protein n=1 Tax=Prosthecochloris ethylica TaxID=2743976 RepID=A0ABR9XRK0_9CHLB|nr:MULTISPECIES: ATP-binding cassette domain-containing protein [Prosthecochloris]MBF0586742.1 ATP-binding cassette domain-containing protein [Prosthecochloris ethylica]MBF0636648.1 ATP-binding cassette domain-containing protein [Prosthecochloris ethylica]NUK47953.1 ATP-binding cassette domain-containing protein [Prosthecochloris ethylica]RNA65255.1 ATP-binding cassette domain-containing protein [Prosthecochloris sp. ZM_2]